jgi:hypothetical protein
MLEPGRPSHAWVWAIGFAVIAVVVGTLYALNTPTPQNTASESTATQASGSNATPQSQPSGGRTTGSAPPEQQAQGQTGKGTGGEQNPAAGTQGNQQSGQGAAQGKNNNNTQTKQ